MHQQLATSPDGPGPHGNLTHHGRLRRRVQFLADHGVSIQGVAPELASDHLRWVFLDEDRQAAYEIFEADGWEPQWKPAFTRALNNVAGTLHQLLADVEAHGYQIESVLVLATETRGKGVLVSVGIDKKMSWSDWQALGGWGDEHPDV